MTAAAVLDRFAHAGITLTLDGDGLRYRAPKGALTDALRADLAAHRAEIVAMLSVSPNAAGERQPVVPDGETMAATLLPRHAIPAGCIAPITCQVVGVCGRPACIPADERAAWANRIAAARDPGNKHRVPDEWIGEGGAVA